MSGVFVHQESNRYTGPRLPRGSGSPKSQGARGTQPSKAARSPAAATPTSTRVAQADASGNPHRVSQPAQLASPAACSGLQSAAQPRITPSSSRQVETTKTLRDVQTALLAVQKVTVNLEAGPGNVSCRSDQLIAARAARKAQLDAVERSRAFTGSIFQKLEDLRDSLASCSTSCSTDSPRELASPGWSPVILGAHVTQQASAFCFDTEVCQDQCAGLTCRLARAPAQAWLP